MSCNSLAHMCWRMQLTLYMPYQYTIVHLIHVCFSIAVGILDSLGLAIACRYATYLHDTLAALAADKDADVRLQLASCFHLVQQFLTRERCLQHLKR